MAAHFRAAIFLLKNSPKHETTRNLLGNGLLTLLRHLAQ
jgi:cytochrome P450